MCSTSPLVMFKFKGLGISATSGPPSELQLRQPQAQGRHGQGIMYGIFMMYFFVMISEEVTGEQQSSKCHSEVETHLKQPVYSGRDGSEGRKVVMEWSRR
ncbi:hypothetical protein ACFE04_008995 [Oxalis oulophora]